MKDLIAALKNKRYTAQEIAVIVATAFMQANSLEESATAKDLLLAMLNGSAELTLNKTTAKKIAAVIDSYGINGDAVLIDVRKDLKIIYGV